MKGIFLPLQYLPRTDQLPVWLIAVLFGVPFFGGIFLYIYKTRHARSWRKGIFPAFVETNRRQFFGSILGIGGKVDFIRLPIIEKQNTIHQQLFQSLFQICELQF
jgi:hypothetical protein